MENRVLAVIRGMVESSDLQKVLDDASVSPTLALRMLRSKQGRRQLKARRQLARIHSELVAHRFGPFAVHKLTHLMSDEKPELRLKGALSVLQVGGLDRHRPSKTSKTQEKPDAGVDDTVEFREVMATVAEVLEQRARARQEAETLERAGVCLETDEARK